MTHEKYGVVQGSTHTKRAAVEGPPLCPSCHERVTLKGTVLWCPNCGTKPFEEKHGKEEGEATSQ